VWIMGVFQSLTQPGRIFGVDLFVFREDFTFACSGQDNMTFAWALGVADPCC